MCGVQCCSAWCAVHGMGCMVAGVQCLVCRTQCMVCIPGSAGKCQDADGAAGEIFTCVYSLPHLGCVIQVELSHMKIF